MPIQSFFFLLLHLAFIIIKKKFSSFKIDYKGEQKHREQSRKYCLIIVIASCTWVHGLSLNSDSSASSRL